MAQSPYDIPDDDPEYQALLKQYGVGGAAPEQKQNSAPYEIGRQLIGGLAVDAPKMINAAGEWFSPKGSGAEQMFRDNKEYWAEGEEAWAPQLEGRGAVSSTLIKGARALGPSGVALAGAVAAPWVATPAVAALFGGSQAQDTYDRGIERGLSPDDARSAGWKTGAAEGLLEAGSNFVGGKVAKGAYDGVSTLFGAARAGGLGGALAKVRDPAWVKPFAKDWALGAGVETGTEFAQGATTTAIENAYNISNESPLEQGAEGAQAALGMSLLLGPFAAYGHRNAAQHRKAIDEVLKNPEAPLEQRMQVGKMLHDEVVVPEIGKDSAAQWLQALNESMIQDRDVGAIRAQEEQHEAYATEQRDLLNATPVSKTDQRLGMAPGANVSWGGVGIAPPVADSLDDKTPVNLLGVPKEQYARPKTDSLGMPLDAYSAPSTFTITSNPTPVENEPIVGALGNAIPAPAAPKAEKPVVVPQQSAPKVAKEPKPIKPAGKGALAFENELNKALAENPDDEVLKTTAATWNAGKKTNTIAKELKQNLNVAGPNVTNETPEAALEADAIASGMVKRIVYGKDADGNPTERVEWIKPTGKKAAKGARTTDVDQVAPEDVEDPTIAEGIRMFQAGDSLRTIAANLGGSHTNWGTVLAQHGHVVADRDAAAAQEALETETAAATTETPEDLTASAETPDAAPADYTNTDEFVDNEAENVGVTTRSRMDAGGQTSASTDAAALGEMKRAWDNANAGMKARITSQLKDLGVSVASLAPTARIAYLDIVQKEGRTLTADDVAAVSKVEAALKPTAKESKLAVARQQQKDAISLADDSEALEKGVESLLSGDVTVAADMLELLGGKNGVRLMQWLRSHFGMPASVNTPKAAVEYFVGKQADAKATALTKAEQMADLWGAGFDKLTDDQKIDFAKTADGMGDLINTPSLLRQIKEEINGTDQARQSTPESTGGTESNPAEAQRPDTGGAGEGGTNQSRTPEVKVRKKRTIEKPGVALSENLGDDVDGPAPVERIVTNPVLEKLKAAGKKFSKAKWPTVTVADMRAAGITPTDVDKYFRVAGVHETSLGDARADGFMFVTPANPRGKPMVPKQSRFSEGQGTGIPASKLSNTLRKLFFSPAKFDQLVTVVQSASDLAPQDFAQLSQADPNKVYGFTSGGKVVLIADNIPAGKELAVFLHEAGVHLGMENLIGKANMERLSAQVEKWAAKNDGSQESEIAKRAVARAKESSSSAEFLPEENIAYFIEEAVAAGIDPYAIEKMKDGALKNWFRSLWAAAKVALRKIGLMRFDQLTAQDLVNLAYGAAKIEMTGTWHGTAADFRNFDHKYMGSGEGAQAFGWGTYLAQRPGIAKGYWKDDVRRKGGTSGAVTGGAIVNERTGEIIDIGAMVAPEMPPEDNESLRRGIKENNKFSVATAVRRFLEEFHPEGSDYWVLTEMPSVTNGTDGAMMRVDTAVHDDELIDLEKPVSKQSATVQKALAGVKEIIETIDAEFLEAELDNRNADWEELTGGELIMYAGQPGVLTNFADHGGLYDMLLVALGNQRADAETKEAFERGMLTFEEYAGKENVERINKMSPDRVVSEYLDSIGIKGIKFLDSASRSGNAHVQWKRSTDTWQVLNANGSVLYEAKDEADADAWLAKNKPAQTRNLVIFNDKNVQRVMTEVGASKEKIKFSQGSKTAQAIEKQFGSSGVQVWENAATLAQRAFRQFMSLHDVVAEYGDILPSAKAWHDSVLAAISTRKKLEADAESIAARAGKLKRERLKVLNDFVSRSTYEQKWGYDATFDKADGTKRKVVADPEMAKAFKSLRPDEQQIAKDIFAHGEKMKQEKYAILKELELEGEFNKAGALDGPYAPLKRFGDFIGVAKSKELVAAEAAEDKKKIEELKADPDHYLVSYFDTKGQAAQFARESAKAGWHFTQDFAKSVKVNEGRPMKPETLNKVLSAIKAEKLPPGTLSTVTEAVKELYFSALDEHNARTSGLKRKNRAGYDADMVRSFLSHAQAEAGFLANMKHGGATNDLFYKLQNESAEHSDRAKAQEVFNTLASHYAANLDQKATPIQDRVMALTSIQQLATNPAYHIQNLMQPGMVTVPRLAADFGDYAGAWRHLLNGYKVAGLTGVRNIDLSKVKNPNLRAMLTAAEQAGLLDVGMDEDLNQFTRTRSGFEAVDNASGGLQKLVHKLRQISRMVEATNRISAGTAAYNMALEKNYSPEKAAEYAISVLRDTQGDFSRTDAPLILKKLPKVVGQYRKFQLMMAAHYVKAFRDAFLSDDANTKAVGRRALAYSLGHAFMTAGALGLPTMNIVAMIFAATGDDDEPKDLERWLREALGNDTAADMLTHGPLMFAGLDAKLAQDKVFAFLPYSDWDLTSKKGVTNLVTGAMGPSMSNAAKMADGLGLMGKGEYHKGLEKLLPSGLSNSMKAYRVANEGYTLPNGDVMVKPEDIAGFPMLMDSIGLKGPDMRKMDWMRSQQYEVKQFYTDRTKEIQHDYAQAAKDGDKDAMMEARDDWMALQNGKENLRLYFNGSRDELKRQPLSNLLRYPQTQAQRERKLQKSFDADS